MYAWKGPSMTYLLTPLAALSILFAGSIFGFFYAWVCSTMWGLDAADPRVAIAAMQAMNASVRNPIFFPAFFLTPAVLGLTAVAAYAAGNRAATAWFSLGGGVYLFFGMFLTMAVNVPMNEALALVPAPDDRDVAAVIWRDYSAPWQFWNTTRTIASGASLLFASLGAIAVGRASR